MTSGSVRIGLCDDHPVVRSGVRAILDGTPDLRLVLAVESVEALRRAIEVETVDMLLLDLDLPDGSGLDAIQDVARRTKVVVLSALADPRSVRRALERGATGFIRKDASPDDIVRSIRRGLSGQTALSADVAMLLADSMRADSDATKFRQSMRSLTPRQREVVELVADGRSNREIAKLLFLSEGTVRNHVSQILDVVGLPDRTRLAVLVSRYGIGS